MDDSVLLYKYPCGCVGLGSPHPPKKVTENVSTRLVWENVMVIRVCDGGRYDDDDGWTLPFARDLVGFSDSVKSGPVPVTKLQEDDFFLFMRNTMRDAAKWRQARSVIRTVLEEVANEPGE